MRSAVLTDDDWFGRHRRRRLPRWTGPAAAGLLVLGMVAAYLLRAPTIGERDIRHRIINVVLPPPPPPPKVKPPEPKVVRPKPQKVLEQPKPLETPPPTPPPPEAPPSEGLTAREGNGPSNFGLTIGNGSGMRIGGGDNGFAAYGQLLSQLAISAVNDDPRLAHDRFELRVQLTVSPEGRIVAVRLESGTGDPQRDAEIERLLTTLVLSRPPPAGLPPVRIQLSSR